MSDDLRNLPSVDRLVGAALDAGVRASHAVLVDVARDVLERARAAIRAGEGAPSLADLVERTRDSAARNARPALAGVINATGILLHTGLGRAPLGPALARAASELDGRYAPVELDMESGRRGKRRRVVEPHLRALTGAEAATVVNNNAAAMVVALGALAPGREVIVSRGELVEIGGSFRLPEIIETGGARLREIGTTNRTRAADYERAINEDTAAILKVHPSNYTVEGFSEQAALEDIAAIGRAHALPVLHDIGSGLLTGALRDAFGLDEPTAEESLRDGADLVLFSGDKLLGACQAGIIVGRADLVGRIEGHPLMRAVRVDKITLGVLGETLRLLRDPGSWETTLPALAMARQPVDDIRARAADVAAALADADAKIEVIDSESFIGGGSAPGQALASAAVRIRADHDLAARLRDGEPPVVARIKDGAVIVDMRGVQPREDGALIKALRAGLEAVDASR